MDYKRKFHKATRMPTSLDSIFFHWTLSSLLLSHRSGVRCRLPCPWFHANCLSAPFSNHFSSVSPYHFRVRRDFRSKNPLSGFTPRQTKKSSAWRATYIVLHTPPSYPCHLFTIHYNTEIKQNKGIIQTWFHNSNGALLASFTKTHTIEVTPQNYHKLQCAGMACSSAPPLSTNRSKRTANHFSLRVTGIMVSVVSQMLCQDLNTLMA